MVFPGDVPDWGGTTQPGLYAKAVSINTALTPNQALTLIPGIAGQNIYLFSGNATSRKTVSTVVASLNQTIPALGTVQVIGNVANFNAYLFSGEIAVAAGGAQAVLELLDGGGSFLSYLVCASGSALGFDFQGKQLTPSEGLVLENLQNAATANIWFSIQYAQLASADTPFSDRIALQDTNSNTIYQFNVNASAPLSWDLGFAKLPAGVGLQLKNQSGLSSAQFTINQLYLQG